MRRNVSVNANCGATVAAGDGYPAAVLDVAPPDRPWQVAPIGRWSRQLVRSWRKIADDQSRRLRPAEAGEAIEPYAAGVSVIVWIGRGEAGEKCLASLAEQTLCPNLFEVIIVARLGAQTRALIERFRNRCPALSVRVVWMNEANAPEAWNAGIAAATRQYATFVDGEDHVSATFLAGLLAHADPGVILMSGVAGADPAGTALSNAGKVVATHLIKGRKYLIDLRADQDAIFWATLAVTSCVRFASCPPAENAVYYRGARTGLPPEEPDFERDVRLRLQVISHLDRLVSRATGGHRDLVVEQMRAQAREIGRYLARCPDDRAAVVQAMDCSGIAHMPYAEVNGSSARGLVAAYAFPPYAGTSSLVMARRLRARGDVADVIYNRQDEARHRDETSRLISGPFVGWEAALATPTSFSSWETMQEFAEHGLRVIAEWEARKGRRYEWVYSRAQSAASHFLAAAYKLANPSTRWIAEFSDPISRDTGGCLRGCRVPRRNRFARELLAGLGALGLPAPKVRRVFVWCEEIAYALADELVFINSNQRDYMLSYCSVPRLADIALSKSVIAPHPTLPSEFYSMVHSSYKLDPGPVNLAYFGAFYPNRGLDDVLIALARTEPEVRARLRLHVFTAKPAEFERRAAELGVSGIVVAAPLVPYLEFLNLTTRFDCLIVNDAVTVGSHPLNPYLPSKLSDYRGSGRSIWGLVEAGSPLSREPLEFMTPLADPPHAMSVLNRLAARKAAERG